MSDPAGPLTETILLGNLAVWAAIIVGWVMFFTVILIPLALIVWAVAGIAGLVFHIRGALAAKAKTAAVFGTGMRPT